MFPSLARPIAFHWATGHVIIASQSPEDGSQVLLYSKNGDCERGLDIALEKNDSIWAATVTIDGRICVLIMNSKLGLLDFTDYRCRKETSKVLVL